ncbi:MAG: BMP family ABC transporter substrate-binding protein [Mogibacterium sp.]|nr:BMP family ABC transporter substrate-binding protein [Mogibacterium sp.]
MKKFLALLVSLLMVLTLLVSCGGGGDTTGGGEEEGGGEEGALKVGLITLHDENSTYDKNFLDAFNESCSKLGVEAIIETNVPEGQECYDKAMDLVDKGCSIIFADSFGHEDFMIQAAKEAPDVQFCHATGVKAHTEGLANYHNAFAAIYEGRYLAGVVAGMKLNEMIDGGTITADQAKMGYVGAYTYNEVVSGYSSFFLGAKSVCPTVTMDVTFTGSWYDETAEKEGANKLIQNGCVLISQHADSFGAPTACEAAGVPNVSYNGSTKAQGPNTYLVSSRINWSPYYEYAIGQVQNGGSIDADWTGTLDTGSVEILELGDVIAEGTQDKLVEVEAGLKDGSIHVFDVSTFTIKGEALPDGFEADVDSDPEYQADTPAVSGGYFHESEYRSAPYFPTADPIDGISLLDTAF